MEDKAMSIINKYSQLILQLTHAHQLPCIYLYAFHKLVTLHICVTDVPLWRESHPLNMSPK